MPRRHGGKGPVSDDQIESTASPVWPQAASPLVKRTCVRLLLGLVAGLIGHCWCGSYC